jgi:hypothetical protein
MKARGRKWVATASLAAVALVVAVVAPGAWAGKPEMERIDIDVTFFDEFLSEECGIDVWTTARGLIVFRSLDGPQLVELTTLNIALTATADGNTYRFRDVGADQVRITKDGAILSIIGQVPFEFIGVLKINLDTDEVVHEPGHLVGDRLAEACAALTA